MAYLAAQSRKSHRKSRLGCVNCKKRKIKCDEARPTCGNCSKRGLPCDYCFSTDSAPVLFVSSCQDGFSPRQTMPADSAQEPCTAIANKPFHFSAIDMAIFHHLMTSAELHASYPTLRTHFTRLGFSFHYLLRLLLAFSSFHLARNDESRLRLNQIVGFQVDSHAEGERRYMMAVREVADQVPLLAKENGLSLFASAVFIFLCTLAKGPQPGEYLAFRSDGQPGSLSLFMGVRSILDTCTTKLSIDISVLYLGGSDGCSSPSTNKLPTMLLPRNPMVRRDYAAELNRLDDVLSVLDPKSDTISYHHAVQQLHRAYHLFYGPDTISVEDTWPVIFGWLYLLPDHFMNRLQHGESVSLVVLAFFAVILKELDSTWFIAQWAEHIMNGIIERLDQSYQQYIRWPMKLLKCSSSPCSGSL
ncbi:hypothetical protein BDV19DRAFT_373012 [Aspergillus venezuelensis]